MKTNYQKVIDFNKCFGHFLSDIEYEAIFKDKEDIVKLKYSLINEEVNELIDAHNKNDFIEIIDALADIKYVLYGMCSAFGINIDINFRKNISLKLSKLNRIDLFDYTKSNFSLVKILRDSWNLKNKKNINISNFVDFKYLLNPTLIKINEINLNLKQDILDKNFTEVKYDLENLLFSVNTYGILIDIDLDKAFDIVHNSNMTKICETEQLAKDTVKWYKQNDERYKSPDYFKNEFGYIVFNKETGKTLKSIKYKPANFDSLL